MKAYCAVSCVIPTLNSSRTLEETLMSLLRQRNCQVKVIVADSGSTDGTLDICRRWGVPSIYVRPGNMYQAINEGLEQCSTDWLAYLNSDDMLYNQWC